jgi:hypothetical protein
MAMTKTEQQQLAAARESARLCRALRWSDYGTTPDLPIPRTGYTEGWTFNAYTARVERAWSERNAHGSGPYPTNGKQRYGVQGGLALFSSRLRALAALRRMVELDAARKLSTLDEQIEQERVAEAPDEIADREAGLWADVLVSNVATVTQLDVERDELPNVDDWRRNAAALFRRLLAERSS